MISRVTWISLAASSLVFANVASAQVTQYIPFTGNERIPLTITMSPADPAPGDMVTLTLTSPAIDLERSVIIWTQDGVPVPTQQSPKQLVVRAPELGKTITIEARAETAENVARATAQIVPVDVDILWSTDSYAPPFYKGRVLPGSLSTVRAFALVRFKRTDATFVPDRDIVYTWSKNGAVIETASGRGRSSIILPGPQLFGNDVITLRAESVDGSFSGKTEVRIPALDAQLVLYENHPLFGILYHRAIVGDVNTSEREQKVTVVPYFAHTPSPGDMSLDYEWRVNEEYIEPDPKEPETLTIDASNFSGAAVVALTVSSLADIAMRAEAKWRLIFGEGNSLFTSTPFGN